MSDPSTHKLGDKYQLIFENAPLGALHFDQNGIITACNDAFVKIIGSSKEALLGLDMCKLPNQEVVAAVKMAINGKNGFYTGLYDSITGKKTTQVRVHFAPYFNQNGENLGGVGIVEDVTELVKSQTTLKQSEQNITNLLDNLPGMAYRCLNDRNWTMEYLSSGCFQLTGYSQEELTKPDSQGYNALIIPDDRDKVWDTVQAAILEKKKFEVEYRITLKSGATKWVWERGSATGISHEGVEVIEGFIADVQEKKHAEIEIAEKQAYFEKLFEASPEGIVILNLEDRIVKANDTFCQMFGYSHEEIFGKAINDLIVPELLKNEGLELTHTVSNGQVMKRETKRQRKDGTLIYVSILASPIIIEDEILAVYGIYRDISIQKETEKDIIVAKEKAEEGDRLKTAFLNNLSHEVRTPMNAIMGFSNLLREGNPDENKTKKLTEAIISSSAQLMSVIDAIVNVSTIEAGLLEVTEQDVDLKSLLDKIFRKYEAAAAGKNIRLRLRYILSKEQSRVIADEYKLLHILTTLLDNSLKFTASGQIEVGCKVEDGHIKMYVADTGVGIDPSLHNIIFDRFRQGVEPPGQLNKGLGLGLSIAKSYIDMMGGNIWLDSQSGQGATFYFTIPYKPNQNNNDQHIPAKAMKETNQKTVLVAEDEEYNYYLVHEILSFQDINILHAWNGEEAVQLIQDNPQVDLVLMDIKMPVMNGYEATRLIKDIRPDLPVVALTAYAMIGDREKALQHGCDDYLAKPVTLTDFNRVVEKFLGGD